MQNLEFDLVVVGGGTAGCALAAHLSEDPRLSVALIESGGRVRDPRLRVPGGMGFIEDWSQFSWMLDVEPDVGRNARSDVWRRGRLTGGSSRINGMIWAIGLPRDYDDWAARGATGWDWRSVAPIFRRMETFSGEGSAQRGTSGPMRVEKFRSVHPLMYPLLESFGAAGVPIVDDVNAVDDAGVGITQTNQFRGQRWDAERAYLTPNRRRRNLHVLTGMDADRLMWENDRIAGVECRQGDAQLAIKARVETILSAGPFGSPKLLMQSGIGPSDHLRQHGIAVRHDHPGVGQNMHDHPDIFLEYEVAQATYSRVKRPLGMAKAGLEYLARRTGPATSPATQLYGFMRSAPELAEPDLVIFAGPWGSLHFDGAFTQSIDVVSVTPSIARPYSRGHLELRSADPREPLKIVSNMLADERDLALMRRGLRLFDDIVRMAPFGAHVIRRHAPLEHVDMANDDELDAFIKDATGICYHSCSTVRMGADQGAVLDERLLVRNVPGLRVVDASVFPVLPSGNATAAVIMVAERGSDLIREDLKAKRAAA